MTLTTNKQVWKVMFWIFILLSILFTVLFYFRTIFVTLIAGVVLIIITQKLMDDYKARADKYKLPKWRRNLYGYGALIFWLVIIFFFIGNSIDQLRMTVADVDTGNQSISAIYIDKVKPFVPDIIESKVINENNIKWVEDQMINLLTVIFSNLSFFIINGILIIPLMFYMYFKRRKSIFKKILELVPKKFHDAVFRASTRIGKEMNDFLSAKIVESIVVGSICCLGFFIAGLKGWLFLGVLAGFLNIIPYLGPWIGAIPPVLVALLHEPIVAVYVIVTVLVAQAVDNFYLIPFMISSYVKMDPLISIILILVGAQLLGILGMLFALPIYLIYKIILKESYAQLVKILK